MLKMSNVYFGRLVFLELGRVWVGLVHSSSVVLPIAQQQRCSSSQCLHSAAQGVPLLHSRGKSADTAQSLLHIKSGMRGVHACHASSNSTLPSHWQVLAVLERMVGRKVPLPTPFGRDRGAVNKKVVALGNPC
jgi:hypothetical protein